MAAHDLRAFHARAGDAAADALREPLRVHLLERVWSGREDARQHGQSGLADTYRIGNQLTDFLDRTAELHHASLRIIEGLADSLTARGGRRGEKCVVFRASRPSNADDRRDRTVAILPSALTQIQDAD